MSACSRAESLYLELAAVGAGDVDRDDSLVACPACQAAVERAGRFDASLTHTARAMASDAPMRQERRTPMPRRSRSLLLAAAGGASLLVVAAVALAINTGAWRLGESAGAPTATVAPSAHSADPVPMSEEEVNTTVTSLTGAPVAQSLTTEDGVAALAYDGSTLSLVLVRDGAFGPQGTVLAAMPLEVSRGAGITAGTAVVCPDLDAVRQRYLIGYFQSSGPHRAVTLEGARAIGGPGPEGTFLFALDQGSIDPVRGEDGRPSVVVRGDGGVNQLAASWFEQPAQMGARNVAGCFVH
ncbi:MAG: hypothetical protein H0V12_09800 [Chloroflexi bacterium]|nr:hypothetical protein [Chloroflexota bacterium]